MQTFAIVGDLQTPYHDPRAVSVAAQIIRDTKPDVLILNGDLADFRGISRYPTSNPEGDERLLGLSEELEKARTTLKEFIKGCGAKKVRALDGNHEWRVQRAFEKDDRMAKLVDLKAVREALSTPGILKFSELGIHEYVGTYPSGTWLHPRLPEHENCWVEHGYRVNKHAAYTASNLMRDRMASVVVNHVEKLAGPVWTRALGRDYFAIENGNLSIIGETEGAGIYGGVPHSEPRYMNHRQGFSILYHDGRSWSPFTIKIRDGRAIWNGKAYKS